MDFLKSGDSHFPLPCGEKGCSHFLPIPTSLIHPSELNSTTKWRMELRHQALSCRCTSTRTSHTAESEQQAPPPEDQHKPLAHSKSIDHRVLQNLSFRENRIQCPLGFFVVVIVSFRFFVFVFVGFFVLFCFFGYRRSNFFFILLYVFF